jgi:predicted permease
VIAWLSSLPGELHRVGRSILRNRRRSTLVIVVTGLSLATNAVMFGILERLFFSAPPLIRDPGRIVRITEGIQLPGRGATDRQRLSYPAFAAIADRVPDVQQTAGSYSALLSIGDGTAASRVEAAYVTHSYFDVLGVSPLIGRRFSEDEDEPPNGRRVVLLGESLWQRQFGGRSDVIGRPIQLEDGVATIIGVMPAGFRGVEEQRIDVWLPLSVAGSRLAGNTWDFDGNTFWIQAIARVKPNVSISTIRSISADAASGHGAHYRVGPLNRARSADRPMEVTIALSLGGVALVVLLIACANVGTLHLVRGIERQSELAVRLALGGSRAHLAATLLSETIALTAAGAVFGLAVAFLASRLVTAYLPEMAGASALDGTLLLNMVGLSVIVTILTGVVPLTQLREQTLDKALRQSGRTTASAGATSRLLLLGGQVALTTALLTGAGLFLLSFKAVSSIDTGFDPEHVVVVKLPFDSEQPVALLEERYHEIQRVLSIRPEISQTAIGMSAPFLSGVAVRIEIPGRDSLPSETGGALYVNAVTPEFFATLGLRLMSGRLFSSSDPSDARLAVITREFARTIWPTEGVLGRCIHLYSKTNPCFEVVGVVDDPKRDKLGEDPVSQFFIPLASAPRLSRNRLLFARVSGPIDRGVSSIIQSVRQALPAAPYPDVKPLADVTGLQRRPWALGALLFGIFAGLALIISCLGLFNIVFHDVTSRGRELAIRRTLGARGVDIVRSVLFRTGIASLTGLGAGVAIGVWIGALLQPLLFRTAGVQTGILMPVVGVVALTASFAMAPPILTALRAAPALVLREE